MWASGGAAGAPRPRTARREVPLPSRHRLRREGPGDSGGLVPGVAPADAPPPAWEQLALAAGPHLFVVKARRVSGEAWAGPGVRPPVPPPAPWGAAPVPGQPPLAATPAQGGDTCLRKKRPRGTPSPLDTQKN